MQLPQMFCSYTASEWHLLQDSKVVEKFPGIRIHCYITDIHTSYLQIHSTHLYIAYRVALSNSLVAVAVAGSARKRAIPRSRLLGMAQLSISSLEILRKLSISRNQTEEMAKFWNSGEGWKFNSKKYSLYFYFPFCRMKSPWRWPDGEERLVWDEVSKFRWLGNSSDD